MNGELQNEEGFTIIEVLVAALIIVLGSLAVFMAFSAGVHNIQRSRETQIGISVAQREMERARVTPYEEVGLSSIPVFSSNAKLPENRITTVSTRRYFNLKRSGTAEPRPMLEGTLEPKTENVRSNDGSVVTVYRFVTCEETEGTSANCLAKRVVIDVLPVEKGNLGTYQHSYYELQSTIVDPTP